MINIIYEKLAETDSLQVFNYNSVKALSEVKWTYIKKRIIIFQLMPYVFFMICFIIYTTYDLEFYDTIITDDKVDSSATLRVLIWICISYFASMEVR